VAESQDILNFYNLANKKAGGMSDIPPSSVLEQKILAHLGREPMEADALARELSIPAAQLGITLTMMQLKNIINQENGKYYVN
jgi:predicted Rossmann fold nucleotide-binding protein DprA/Smf involved in DNA uptake